VTPVPTTPTISILGIPIAAVTFDEALRLFLDAPASGHRIGAHFCTTHTLVEADDDEAMRKALVSGVALPDGAPLVWVGRARGARIERVCGLDLMPALMDRGRTQGARHYLYGGAPGTPELLAQRLTERYPGLAFVGIESPPFRPLLPEERLAVVARINAAKPDFVWVGLGTPKQDYWVAEYRPLLEAPALLAVGAAFDIVSGRRRRAPVLLQRLGAEWLFRLLLEPRRLWRRYLKGNSLFIWRTAREVVSGRHRRSRRARLEGVDTPRERCP
jgi:N-acetylglucosaminyldiphosphoundecaprenol N-acetyl-beta-D-mannosaminyltransferase